MRGARDSTGANARGGLRWPRRAYLLLALVMFGTVAWAHTSLSPLEEGRMRHISLPDAGAFEAPLGGWLWYDAHWYVKVADNGYAPSDVQQFHHGRQSAAPFFPAYPIAVATSANLMPNAAVAAIVVTFVCGLLTALLFWRWCKSRLGDRASKVGFGLLFLYPYAWYLYGAGYADALFLAAALAAFLLLEDDRPLAAGIVGVIATAARPTGVFVAVGLVAVMLHRRSTRRAPAQGRDWWVLLAFAGVAAFSAFSWWRFGDPLAFVTNQRAWAQSQGAATWLKDGFIRAVHHRDILWWGRLLAQGVLGVAFIGASVAVFRRFGWGYGLYALLMALVPTMATGDFMGVGRYLLACFPTFAAAGAWLAEHRRAAPIALAASGLTLLTLTTFFARGVYLS